MNPVFPDHIMFMHRVMEEIYLNSQFNKSFKQGVIMLRNNYIIYCTMNQQQIAFQFIRMGK
ncbi:hypothetical protein D3C80_2194650 [compost metagenome]